MPLLAILIPSLQVEAVLVSLAAALASGLTAHHSLKLSVVVTVLTVISATLASTLI